MPIDLDRILFWAVSFAFFVMLGFWVAEVRHSNSLEDLALEAVSELGYCVRISEGRLKGIEMGINSALGVE